MEAPAIITALLVQRMVYFFTSGKGITSKMHKQRPLIPIKDGTQRTEDVETRTFSEPISE
jgi:hypothetical protein